jgi:hypothetical protein
MQHRPSKTKRNEAKSNELEKNEKQKEENKRKIKQCMWETWVKMGKIK